MIYLVNGRHELRFIDETTYCLKPNQELANLLRIQDLTELVNDFLENRALRENVFFDVDERVH